jgi:hypothetical protein
MKKLLELFAAWRQRWYYSTEEVATMLVTEREILNHHHLMLHASELAETRHKRAKFEMALLDLLRIKMETKKPFYEIRVSIHMDALDTAAGDAAAIAMISNAVADQLLARHRKEGSK